VARAEAAARIATSPAGTAREPSSLRAGRSPEDKKEAGSAATVQRALAAVVEEIPAEVVAAYIAVLPALPHNAGRTPQVVLFVCLFIATPILQWGLTARQLVMSGLPLSVARRLPWRGMATSTISFGVWASALPDSVAQVIPGFQPYMGVIAIVVLQVLLISVDGLFPRRAFSDSAERKS
jgi:hypothetical protein